MTRDILTVARKELREFFVIMRSPGQILSTLVFLFIFGIFIPISMGQFFLKQTSTSLSLYILMLPLVTCGGLVADTFAGERERRTLESLLATRLPDSAIFIGKVIAVVVFTYVYVQLVVLISILGANIHMVRSGMDGVFFYNALSSFALFAFNIPVILAGTAIGVFFSLKCRELRTASQLSRVSWVIISFPFISGFVKFEISWRFLVPAFYIVFMLDAVLLWAGVRYFRRDRLLD